ncbi:hypothetical protein KCP75_06115 [Salmonella enterica subsp. enterica]|nr:hypothetical protein KCP75_06115 [Salmonella enterica subsp. enterica]
MLRCCMISPRSLLVYPGIPFLPARRDKRHVGEFSHSLSRIKNRQRNARRFNENRRRRIKQFPPSAGRDRAPVNHAESTKVAFPQARALPVGETVHYCEIARQCGFRSAYAGRATPRRRTICRRSTDR